MEESNLNRQNNAVLNPYAMSAPAKTGYADVDNLNQQGTNLINQSVNTQVGSIQRGVETNVNELNRQKQKAEAETLKNNKAFYQQYQKQINPYGATQEALAAQGLGHSGIAESTRTNIYNTYQKNVTDSLNNLKQVSADYDAKMAEVRSNGDIATAEAISNAYLQQLDQIKYSYQLAQAQKEFEYNKSVNDRNYNYQVERDRISDQRYADELAYQKQRDAVADDQWRQQFELSKKNSSSGSSGRGSSKKYSVKGSNGNNSNSLILSDGEEDGSNWADVYNTLKQIGKKTGESISTPSKITYNSLKNGIANLFR